MPPPGLEPGAYRLEGGRSVRLSYRGLRTAMLSHGGGGDLFSYASPGASHACHGSTASCGVSSSALGDRERGPASRSGLSARIGS